MKPEIDHALCPHQNDHADDEKQQKRRYPQQITVFFLFQVLLQCLFHGSAHIEIPVLLHRADKRDFRMDRSFHAFRHTAFDDLKFDLSGSGFFYRLCLLQILTPDQHPCPGNVTDLCFLPVSAFFIRNGKRTRVRHLIPDPFPADFYFCCGCFPHASSPVCLLPHGRNIRHVRQKPAVCLWLQQNVFFFRFFSFHLPTPFCYRLQYKKPSCSICFLL